MSDYPSYRRRRRKLAADLHMNMSHQEAAEYHALMGGIFDAYDVVDNHPNPVPAVKYPRTPGYRPQGEENRFGAWAQKSTVKVPKAESLPERRSL